LSARDTSQLERDTTALDHDEIDEAETIIAKMHSMRELFLWEVFPMYSCCLKKLSCCNRVNKRARNLMKQEAKD